MALSVQKLGNGTENSEIPCFPKALQQKSDGNASSCIQIWDESQLLAPINCGWCTWEDLVR